MPSNPLLVFQQAYAQAVANGLPTGAAQLAAQTAMQSAVDQQNSKPPTVAISYQAVNGGRTVDPGPKVPPKRSR